jgi:cell shape-determining protein MreC
MKRDRSGFQIAAALCLVGAGLLLIPAEATRALRTRVRDALRPGQMAVNVAARHVRAWQAPAVGFTGAPGESGTSNEETRLLRLQNRRLELRAARLRERVEQLTAQQGLVPSSASFPPLVTARLVEARILGEETSSLWRGRKLLSAGAINEIAESALVLDDARPLVDLGADALLAEGDAVYAGRTVIGKIAEVGRFTSTLRQVTDPAFSGRARLARRTSRGLVFGAEGTLIGDGTDLCRLKHMTDPVNVDDEVFTGGADGLVPYPMYYGKVVRAELDSGASEWSVCVRPAASDERLESVLVLRRAVNPERIAAK